MHGERRFSVGLHLEDLQIVTQEQLVARHGLNLRSMLVTSIVETVRRLLQPVLERNFEELKKSVGGRNHVIHRMAEQVIYAGGNELMEDLVNILFEVGKDEKTVREMRVRIVDEVLREKFHDVTPVVINLEEMKSLIELIFAKMGITIPDPDSPVRLLDTVLEQPVGFATPVIESWKQSAEDDFTSTGYSAPKQSYDRKPRSEKEIEDQIPGLLKELNARYRYRTEHAFDVVRNAKFRDAEGKDIPHIVELYNSALLQADVLQLLLPRPGDTTESIQERRELVRKRVHKGLLIRIMSVRKMLREMSSEHAIETGFKLNVQVLESDEPSIIESRGHGILAFASTNNPVAAELPTQAETRRKTVRDYLQRGETGGHVHFEGEMDQWLNERIDQLIFGGDIRSTYQFAAERTGALVFDDLMRRLELTKEDARTDSDRYFIASRLRHFGVVTDTPLICDIGHSGVLLENDNSYSLLRSWGMTHIGVDRNKKRRGRHIRKMEADGQKFGVNPQWEIVYGSLCEIAAKSMARWRKTQIKHGDISVDYAQRLGRKK